MDVFQCIKSKLHLYDLLWICCGLVVHIYRFDRPILTNISTILATSDVIFNV